MLGGKEEEISIYYLLIPQHWNQEEYYLQLFSTINGNLSSASIDSMKLDALCIRISVWAIVGPAPPLSVSNLVDWTRLLR